MSLETPRISAVIVQDSEGNRVAAKYYSKLEFPSHQSEVDFERRLFRKTRSHYTRGQNKILPFDEHLAIFRHAGDVLFYVIGPHDENELILSTALDALYESLNLLLKTGVDRRNILLNLELLLLAMDELVDSGIPFELDPSAIEARVMLRGAVPESISSYNEMTLGTVVDKARDKLAKQFAK